MDCLSLIPEIFGKIEKDESIEIEDGRMEDIANSSSSWTIRRETPRNSGKSSGPL
jgi:hypothetical protein